MPQKSLLKDMSASPLLHQQIAEIASVRAALNGESVIDLARFMFPDRVFVDDFLRLHEFDTDNPLDLAHLSAIHQEATVYLGDIHRYRLPLQVEQPTEIHDLFLLASHGAPRVQRFACMVLKVMHIMHHISGRELVFNTAISEAQLFDRLNTKAFTVLDRMRASGVGVHEFAAGKKSRSSLATKLLAKRSNLASQIFDKLRLRITVHSRHDLVRAVLYLTRNLFPFNYVIPGESQNGILTLEDVAEGLDAPLGLVREVWQEGASDTQSNAVPLNEFSGQSYRAVNFVADIPMRIDDVAPAAAPAVAFVQTEIQLVDVETAKANEQGENAHAMYKRRQREKVRVRLESSAVTKGRGSRR